MKIAIGIYVEKSDYERLVSERNNLQQQLVKVENGSNLKRMIVERLATIRTEISNAHREQYRAANPGSK